MYRIFGFSWMFVLKKNSLSRPDRENVKRKGSELWKDNSWFFDHEKMKMIVLLQSL